MPALSTPPPPSATIGGPGPQGPPGQSAYTFSTADVVNYDGVSNMTIAVQDVSWLGIGAPVFIPNVGTLEVTAIDTTNKVLTLLPLKTDVGSYPHTIPSGTMVAANGYPGLNGATGNTGPQGVPGPQGAVGPQGLQGPAGTTGSTGTTGPQGPTGQQGVAGPPGTTGATGATGPQGPIGVKGDQGVQGIQGGQGPSGPQGASGPIGATGPQGPQGPPGPAVTAQGAWTPTGVYAQGDLVTWNNLIYIGLRASQNAQPDTHPQDWAVYSSIGIQGPPGATGPAGPAGAQGPQGLPGPQGPIGADGATGATGPAGAAGPTGNPGPQGLTGATGATGPTGPTGPQGVPGPSVVWRGTWSAAATYNANDGVSYNGSSYVAVATNSNHPPDTHPTEWQLIAQQGAVGPTGPQGVIGPAGPTGPQGPTGSTGSQGPAGATGPPGPTVVSGDAGNTAMLGSDSRLYVPATPLASPTKQGSIVQLSNKATDVLNGTNAFGPVPLATNANQGGIIALTNKATDVLLGTNTFGPVPLATPTTQGGIIALSNKTTDFLDGTNHFQDLATAIWSARLRSFNAIGNAAFEVDARTAGAGVIFGGASSFALDRWVAFKSGGTTMAGTAKQTAGTVLLPGTNFAISADFLRVTLTAAQATLAASDLLILYQSVEGAQLRELIGDVHSVSLLVRSSVAGLSFGLSLRDQATSRSLTKLCTIPSANTWILIALPALPVWSAGGTFPLTPGVLGYTLTIALAAGTTFTAPANDTWQNGNFVGAVGQANFAAQAVNSTLDIAYIGHEPGALCSTPQDCPFPQAFDQALRYFQKTYDYGTAVGTVTPTGARTMSALAAAAVIAYGPTSFHKPMAKAPTVTFYNNASGAANSVRDGAGTDHAASPITSGLSGFPSLSFSTGVAAANGIYFHYTADTGW